MPRNSAMLHWQVCHASRPLCTFLGREILTSSVTSWSEIESVKNGRAPQRRCNSYACADRRGPREGGALFRRHGSGPRCALAVHTTPRYTQTARYIYTWTRPCTLQVVEMFTELGLQLRKGTVPVHSGQPLKRHQNEHPSTQIGKCLPWWGDWNS